MNGDDNRSYYVSFGNVTSNGIMPTDVDSYNRNSVAMRGQAKFLKLFTVSGALNYVRKDMKYTPTGQDQAVLDAVWQTPRDINIVDLQDYNNKFNNVDNYYTVYSQNPYYVANEHGTKFGEDRIFGNLALNADILPWLKASFKVGTDVSNSTYKGWRAVTYCARATYNDTEGEVSEGAYRAAELNTDLILTAAQKFGDFAIDGLLGHNFNQQQSRSQLTSVVGLDVPFFYNISNSASTPSISEGISERRLVGIYANLNAGWKDMLYLNMTARNDWSSTLPVQNRSFFYPSASLSFIFSELMPKNKVLSFGKVRAGLSQTGKDASPYQVYSTYPQMSLTDGYRSQTFPLTSGSSSINGFTVSNQIGNSKLQPEISTELEIGFDVRFLDNRIGLDFAYYDATTTDLIFPVQITPSSGYTTQVMNLGKLSNKGFEIAANFVPVKTKDFVWDFSINFSKNDNKLVELNDLLTQVTIGGTSSISYVARPGEPFLFSALQHPKNFR
jgi:outer membrane receptor protein involved in Fe transport